MRVERVEERREMQTWELRERVWRERNGDIIGESERILILKEYNFATVRAIALGHKNPLVAILHPDKPKTCFHPDCYC